MTNGEMTIETIKALSRFPGGPSSTTEILNHITRCGWQMNRRKLCNILRHLARTGEIETKRIGRENFHQIND